MTMVLGIDPGTRVAGYGIVSFEAGRLRLVTLGAIRPRKSSPFAMRLAEVHEGLREVMVRWRPDILALEEVFGGKNFQSAIRLGEGRGVALLAAAQCGLPIAEYSAASIKKAVVGWGRAHKGQIQKMVQRILGLSEPPRPADAADALAVAICHGHRIPILERV